MQEFQTNKTDLNNTRLVEVAKQSIDDHQVLLKIDRFAFTANNITYAVMGEQLRYWQFFPPNGDNAEQWGVIPVWGFADVIESKCDDLPVGDRLFGYFPPTNEVVMTPAKITASGVMEANPHRAQLPISYNSYRRVLNEPGYNKANDAEHMLLFVLHLTSFCIHEMFKSNNWFGAEQVVIISASSKTSTGLAYGLADDNNAPTSIGLTSQGNLDFVKSLDAYEQSYDYQDISSIDPNKSTVIVDMSANTEVLRTLHTHLGDNMKYTSNVGLTHWDEPRNMDGINRERSHQFFAPSVIQDRIKEWGGEEFSRRSTEYVAHTSAKSKAWLKIKELDGIQGLSEVYHDVCDGKIAADQGLIVVM